MLNKIGQPTEPWGTLEIIYSYELEDSFFFFFDLSGIYNYSSISKLLHETQVHVAKEIW